MLYKAIVVSLALLAAGVIPTPTRPRTKRLSRGPAWTDFQSLVVAPSAIDDALLTRREKMRIALVPEPYGSDPARVASEVIRSGLRYGDRLIVMSPDAVGDLFESSEDPETRLTIARSHDIDVVAVIAVDSDTETLTVNLSRGDGNALESPSAVQLPDGVESVIDAAVALRTDLLRSLDSMPPTNVSQLTIKPQTNFDGYLHVVRARRKLADVAGTTEEEADLRRQLCQEALTEVSEAIQQSPDFLEAYVVKASCEDELDQEPDRDQTLKIADQKKSRSTHDLLNYLEVEADYARFVQKNELKAGDAYEAILQVDASDITALWSILDLILFNGQNLPAKELMSDAVPYAAKIVAFHPNSRLAKLIHTQEEASESTSNAEQK